MTLIIEDGSIVENANSYVTLSEARDYANSRGYKFTDFNVRLEEYLLKSMDYLETLRNDYKGVKSSDTQELQWPRTVVYIDNVEVADDSIPKELKRAQIRAAMAIQDGIDLLPTLTSAPFKIATKIGPIETRYSSTIRTGGKPTVRELDALLAPLLRQVGVLSVTRA